MGTASEKGNPWKGSEGPPLIGQGKELIASDEGLALTTES